MDRNAVGGWCDPAFRAVQQEFAANFTHRGEIGAAVSLAVRGTVVAELWGGLSEPERERPWARDTLVNVFSVGKGVLAACLAALVGRGLLDPDACVARYWPEFGAAGKAEITVRQLLSHQAGLPRCTRRSQPASCWTGRR